MMRLMGALSICILLCGACDSANTTVTDTGSADIPVGTDTIADTGSADIPVGTDAIADTVTDTGSGSDSGSVTDTVADTGSADIPVGADTATDTGPCPREGELGDPCDTDCDCEVGLACRGLHGRRWCSVPCASYEGCAAGDAPCNEPTCDLRIGACRCNCAGVDCAEGSACLDDLCVDCLVDADCDQACSGEPGSERPTCHPAWNTCYCGPAVCGDDICDEYAEVFDTCPADCPSPCQEGAKRAFACMGGNLVDWCECTDGAWSCVDHPEAACEGDTDCARNGGMCVATADSCYEGVIADDAAGCSGDEALCCRQEACKGPGEQYYPYLGQCCPGLRALSDVFPMAGGMTGGEGVGCFAGCWILTCAPCGDGFCSPNVGETPCNCPEDCPLPPYDFVCSGTDAYGCGPAHCTQADDVCTDHTPSCVDDVCHWQAKDHAGHICDPVTRTCVLP